MARTNGSAEQDTREAFGEPRLYKQKNGCFNAGHFIPNASGGKKGVAEHFRTTDEAKARGMYADWLKDHGYSPALADAPLGGVLRKPTKRKGPKRKGQSTSTALTVVPQDENNAAGRRRAKQREYYHKRKARETQAPNGADEMIEAAMGSLSAAMSAQAQAMKMLQLAIDMTRGK